MEHRNATVAVIGAGDYLGAAIAKKFAVEGFTVCAGRRSGHKLAPLVADVEAQGGRIFARALDARKEADITAFLHQADTHTPLEVCIFNIGANVNFPLLETTERVFRKVWEMACYAGFLAGREIARLLLSHGRGCIFFTGVILLKSSKFFGSVSVRTMRPATASAKASSRVFLSVLVVGPYRTRTQAVVAVMSGGAVPTYSQDVYDCQVFTVTTQANAARKALASCKPAVSNPSVNQP